MEVAVIGGGIVGLASAYYLAEAGVDVTVYEKTTLGAGSTQRAAGGIRTQFSTPVNVELSKASLEVWTGFEDRFGVDIAHRRTGYLFLAREPETAAEFEANVAMQNDRGVPSEFLEPADAVEYCSGVVPGRFEAATYCSLDGFADPNLGLQGFATAAREAGATVRTGTTVTDLRRRGGEVVGLAADGEARSADFVVNAAGPWARRVGRLADLDLPVAPKRRQVLVVEPERPVPEDDPLAIDLDTGSYFRPERDGNALVGGHFGEPDPDQDPDGFSESTDLDWATEALERAADWTTYFGPEARIKRGWAGLYAVTPDHHPIIEETIPGFINAVGFSGHGFMHAPATGQLVTELVTTGEASLVDIDRLASDRFEGGRLVEERNVA